MSFTFKGNCLSQFLNPNLNILHCLVYKFEIANSNRELYFKNKMSKQRNTRKTAKNTHFGRLHNATFCETVWQKHFFMYWHQVAFILLCTSQFTVLNNHLCALCSQSLDCLSLSSMRCRKTCLV